MFHSGQLNNFSTGLTIVLNVGQDDYVESLAESAGARIVIHPQTRMSFPEDEGILVLPGHATSVGIRKVFTLLSSIFYYTPCASDMPCDMAM